MPSVITRTVFLPRLSLRQNYQAAQPPPSFTWLHRSAGSGGDRTLLSPAMTDRAGQRPASHGSPLARTERILVYGRSLPCRTLGAPAWVQRTAAGFTTRPALNLCWHRERAGLPLTGMFSS